MRTSVPYKNLYVLLVIVDKRVNTVYCSASYYISPPTVNVIRTRFVRALRRVHTHTKNHPRTSILVVVLIVVAGITLLRDGTNENAVETNSPTPVHVATVGALARDTEPLVLLGEVRSVSQAELRAQKSGEVTQVYARADQVVPAGAILAEIDSAAERAVVLSAQGAVAAAEAQLEKTITGARSEDRVSAAAGTQGATISLAAAEESARTTYSQAYALAADAVFAQADDFFSDVYTVDPSFRVRSAEFDERQMLEKERVAIGELLRAWNEATKVALPAADLDRLLAEAHADLSRISSFLNQISTFISEQELTTDLTTGDKAAQEAQMAGARSAVAGARGSVTSARTALANAVSTQVTASFGESKIAVGARSEDIAVAEAAVTQARGTLASASAALENALIRTPIAGTVTTLNVSRGDYVSMQDSIAVVANPGALELEAFVTGPTLERIAVGQSVLIEGTYTGTVTTRSPGLDPQTKKSRITVALPRDADLVNGSFAELAILEDENAHGGTQAETGTFAIPITAVKVLPRGFAVFTVNESQAVEAISIVEGPIIGAKMLVSEGLRSDVVIVTDVRGIKEGDTVEIVR